MFGTPFVLFYSSLLSSRGLLRLIALNAARFVRGGLPLGTPKDDDPLHGLPFTAHYVNLAGRGCLKCKKLTCFGCRLQTDDRDPGCVWSSWFLRRPSRRWERRVGVVLTLPG